MIFNIDNTLIIEYNKIKQKRKGARWRRVEIMTQNVIKSTSNEKIYTIDGFDGVKVYEYPDIVSKKWYRKLEYNGIVGCEHPTKKKLTEDTILNFIEAVDDFNSKGKIYIKLNADYCRKYTSTSIEGIMQGLIFKYEL